jgi:hypothetical protein
VLAWQADERVNVPLVDVHSRGECAADYSQREFETVQPSESDTKRESERRERAQQRDWIAPGPIRARHDVQARREVANEVILQQEYCDETGGDDSSRR